MNGATNHEQEQPQKAREIPLQAMAEEMMITDTKRLRKMALSLRYHDISTADAVFAAADEIDQLRTRLEVDDKTGYDGIECRDVTIEEQDKLIDGLRADNKRLREALRNEAEWHDGQAKANRERAKYSPRTVTHGLLAEWHKDRAGLIRAALQGESK